jgi:hypothetical protein
MMVNVVLLDVSDFRNEKEGNVKECVFNKDGE